MIKYIGSKRKLVDTLSTLALEVGAKSALDAFTGTTRVARAFKKAGIHTAANDIASYSKIFADCYIATDASAVDMDALGEALAELSALPGKKGYFTETFCEQSRFFQPKNGMRVDAIRDAIDEYPDWMQPILMTSLIEAADRVDSTTGVQMAYLKKWAARSYNDLELRVPELIAGVGEAFEGDVLATFDSLASINKTYDLVYLDPPYNQHRYYTNYHIWEMLVRWDAPEAYGVACKRIDSRDDETKSDFNKKRMFADVFAKMLAGAHSVGETAMVSYNDESWLDRAQIERMLLEAGYADVCCLEYDWDRYIGARIGIYDPSGKKVGKVSHTKNHELVFVAGDAASVEAAHEFGEKQKAQE